MSDRNPKPEIWCNYDEVDCAGCRRYDCMKRLEAILGRSDLTDFQKEFIREFVKGERRVILVSTRRSGRAAIRKILQEIFPNGLYAEV